MRTILRSMYSRGTRSYTILRLILLAGLALLVFLAGFGLVAWRLDKSPDIFTDEIIYTRIGMRVSGEGAVVWDSGEPFLVHPPLYFLAQGLHFWLAGDANLPVYAAGDIFALVHQARRLNAVFAGLTAVMLFLIGSRLKGIWLGLLMAVVFGLDPFGVRINRRGMLETLAVLLSLAGIGILLIRQKKRPSSWLASGLLAGLLFGLAMLTKELIFIYVLAVLLLGLWEIWRSRRNKKFALPQIIRPVVAAGVAALTYTIYPLWMLASGYWEQFAAEKWLSLQRLLGLVQLTGWNRPEVSLLTFIGQRLADYGTSYLLLTLGGAATLWLLLMERRTPAGRLLGIWGLTLYAFFGFIALFGSGNDQFFYLLLVPAIVLTGYAFNAPKLPSDSPGPTQQWQSIWFGISKAATALLLLVVLPYNMAQWWSHYGIGLDNGYQQLTAFVQAQIPLDEPINASGDPIKFRYFMPKRAITDAASPSEAVDMGTHYFVLAPKDVWARYGRIKPELADWITTQGERLFAASGDSYGDIYLYRIEYPKLATNQISITEAGGSARWRSFQPARAGHVLNLTVILTLWAFTLTTAAAVLLKRRKSLPEDGDRRHISRPDEVAGQTQMESYRERA